MGFRNRQEGAMRTFNFKSKIIGSEKYLTYVMGEETELDEDVLDLCEENKIRELVEIIYEEDDDYDYLSYDVSNLLTIEEFAGNEAKGDQVLLVLRNIAESLISLKEQTIHLNYILLNKSFMYVDKEDYSVKLICLPVESKASVVAEFKAFVRQFLANLRYDVNENLDYVGKLLTYINGDSFNLRGLIGLSEALMNERGVSFEAAGDIDAGGVEIVDAEEEEEATPVSDTISDFMSTLSDEDTPLPEIGDDEEEPEEKIEVDDELESILPPGTTGDDEITQIVLDDEEPVSKKEEKVVEERAAEETVAEETGAEERAAEEKVTEENAGEKTTNPTSKLDVEAAAPVADDDDDDYVPDKIDINQLKKNQPKESDEDIIKNRIKMIMGDGAKPAPKTSEETPKTIEELDNMLDSKAPVIKKNVVKVNRAAIIQNVAASEEEESNGIPAIGTDTEKPKSNSILSKTVETAPKSTNNLVNLTKAIPYLIRVNTEERIMLSKTTFKLGKASRGVDYTVGGNGAISRQHAVIIRRDDVSYIKDNKSTNHTYVNGKMVEDGEEEILTHDSVIKLGDEEFVFKIR